MHAYVFLFIIHTYILAFIIQIEIYWKQSGQSTAGSCYISLEPPPPSSIAVINVESDSLIPPNNGHAYYTKAKQCVLCSAL